MIRTFALLASLVMGVAFIYNYLTYRPVNEADTVQISGIVTESESDESFFKIKLDSESKTFVATSHLLPGWIEGVAHNLVGAGEMARLRSTASELQKESGMAHVYEIESDGQMLMSLQDYNDAQNANQKMGLYLGIFFLLNALILVVLRAVC